MLEATTILGNPNYQVERRREYIVYRFEPNSRPEGQLIEVWGHPAEESASVFGILRSVGETSEDIGTLEQFVRQYGRPDTVTWASIRSYRYLIWARHGVAVMVWAGTWSPNYEWREQPVIDIVLFSPMSLRQLMKLRFPWPPSGQGWVSYNMYAYMEDVPEDPFDWDTMLREIGTSE